MGLTDRLAKLFLIQATVVQKKPIAKDAVRLTVQSKELKQVKYTPGNHLRVFIGMDQDQALGDKVRTYSIWNVDRENGLADVAICLHSNGPRSQWAKNVQPGDQLYFSKPTGKFTLDPSGDHYFFIGDPSALGHLYEIRRHLPHGKTATSIIYASRKDHLFADVDGSYPFDFYEFPENPLSEVKALLDHKIPAKGNLIFYIAGDGRLCLKLNRYLRQVKNQPRKAVKSKPFWLPGKTGLE